MARKSEIGEFNCGMAQTVDLIGDRWTLLILRNAFNGMNTYHALQEHLDMSSSVLSAELTKLVQAGVFERVRSPEDGRSYTYRLTEKGFDLYPIIACMSLWGEKYAPHPDGKRIVLTEKSTGREIEEVAVLSATGTPLHARDVHVSAGPAADAHTLAFTKREWRKKDDG